MYTFNKLLSLVKGMVEILPITISSISLYISYLALKVK